MVFNWMLWNMGPLMCHTHMSYTTILLLVLAPTPPRIAAQNPPADLATSHSAWCRGAIHWVHHKGVDDIVDGFRNTWVTKIIKNPITVSKPNLVATTGCFAKKEHQQYVMIRNSRKLKMWIMCFSSENNGNRSIWLEEAVCIWYSDQWAV